MNAQSLEVIPLSKASEILEEWRTGEYRHVCRKDIINFNALTNLKRIFPPGIGFGRRHGSNLFGRLVNTILIGGSIHVSREWYSLNIYDDLHAPGSWGYQGVNGYPVLGGDVISLLTHLRSSDFLKNCAHELSAEQIRAFGTLCREGASEQTIVADIVQKLGIDPDRPMTSMPSVPSGWEQSDWAYPSTGAVNGLKAEGATLFRCPPEEVFDLLDERERVQATIASWKTHQNGHVMVSFVPCHRKDDPSEQRWMVAKSTRKLVPFGFERVAACPEAQVVIDDDLCDVRQLNERLQKRSSPPPMVLVGWPRWMSEAKPSDTDWSVLNGRKVICGVRNDLESFRHGLALGQEVSTVDVAQVEFALPKKWDDGHETLRIDPEKGHLEAELVSWHRFQEIANNRFGLSAEGGVSAGRSAGWTLGDPLPDGAGLPDYLLEPVIPKGSAVLLYSSSGVGKSWLALLVSYAIGCGTEILGGRWKANSQHYCLYISTEMARQNIARLDMIDQSIRCPGAEGRVTIKPHPDEPYQKIDLENEEAWGRLSKQIDDADFIVIDHLTNVTNTGEIDLRTWKRVWGFISPLRESGKSILILHHANKTGAQRGTSALEADVDTIIRMESLPDIKNGARVSFDKHRDDVSLGKAFMPFNLVWDRGCEPGTFRWLAKEPENEAQAKGYLSLVKERGQIDEAALEEKFGKDRSASIVKLLAEAALRGDSGLSTSGIVKIVGCSLGTVRKELKSLMDGGTVMQSGEGKATRYALTEQMLKVLTRR